MNRDWTTRIVLLLSLVLLVIATGAVWMQFRTGPFDSVRWQTALGPERGRMLASLLSQTNFVGFARADVERYLGAANFDERQFWYDLGPSVGDMPLDPRAAVGDSLRLYGVFSHDSTGSITSVLYSHRRPTLGSAAFDSIGWFGSDHSRRRTMFTSALGRSRNLGLSQNHVTGFLGPPDGSRVRAHYDVGSGGSIFGGQRALIFEFDSADVVNRSIVTP
ncbi:MAG: hypothetical protein HY304_00470 [candidate division Zixibacteria bacterium]|nr:hypothetical protein [candidate division Zixibacteria bacterium]